MASFVELAGDGTPRLFALDVQLVVATFSVQMTWFDTADAAGDV